MQTNPNPTPESPRTKFIKPGTLVEGTITEVNLNQDPFHCRIKIEPKDLNTIKAEGHYSDHEVSLGKLKRNLVHLKFPIKDVEDIIAAVESLEGRECIFRVDKSGWISWIASLIAPPRPDAPVPAPVLAKMEQGAGQPEEIYLVGEPGVKAIYRMQTEQGEVRGWAVGPTMRRGHTTPHGWVLHLPTKEDAILVLRARKNPLDKIV